ncbi:hypothetical protein AB0N14_07410 [Streptomyces sp. NPDC051104]|uniref:hypothetical protein n=1 Tax=Streptomyces sp. NPDC051104 TaxID=3155044 RepID=UPI00341B4D1D
MGSLRLTLCAGAVVAGALMPAAYAADAQGVVLTPAFPAPGSDVRLAVRGCPGTTGTAESDAFVAQARLVGGDGTLSGDTRVRSALSPGRYQVTVGCDGREIGDVLTVAGPTAPAPDNATPSTAVQPYSPLPSTAVAPDSPAPSTAVAPDSLTASAPSTPPFTPYAATGTTSPGPTTSPSAPSQLSRPSSPSPSFPSSPVAPVHAGGGGTAGTSSDDPRVAVPGLRHAVIGLVLAGVAGVVVVARGARRGRGTE